MATRKIKDAKDLNTKELIYFKGHAKATYLSNGTTVEDAIANINHNQSSIPVITENTVLDWGFTKNSGTITGVSANGTLISTIGTVDIPAASTTKYGVTKLSSSTNSTSTSLAATSSAVKSAYDLANNKQDKLVSGTNIKTINGNDITGSGNIDINTGNPNANVGSVPTGDLLIDDISINRKIINTTEDNITLINNNYYKKTNISSAITISLNNYPDDIVTNYCIEFTTSISGTTVTLPSNIKWLNGVMPYFENDYTYQISIVNGLGVCVKFA